MDTEEWDETDIIVIFRVTEALLKHKEGLRRLMNILVSIAECFSAIKPDETIAWGYYETGGTPFLVVLKCDPDEDEDENEGDTEEWFTLEKRKPSRSETPPLTLEDLDLT